MSDRSDQADTSDGDANGRTEQTGRTRSDTSDGMVTAGERSDDERIKSDSVAMSADSAKKSILDAWLGDLADELIALGGDDTLSDDDFIAKLNQLADKPPISDDAFAAAVQREMQLGYVAGMRKMWQGGAK